MDENKLRNVVINCWFHMGVKSQCKLCDLIQQLGDWIQQNDDR